MGSLYSNEITNFRKNGSNYLRHFVRENTKFKYMFMFLETNLALNKSSMIMVHRFKMYDFPRYSNLCLPHQVMMKITYLEGTVANENTYMAFASATDCWLL